MYSAAMAVPTRALRYETVYLRLGTVRPRFLT